MKTLSTPAHLFQESPTSSSPFPQIKGENNCFFPIHSLCLNKPVLLDNGSGLSLPLQLHFACAFFHRNPRNFYPAFSRENKKSFHFNKNNSLKTSIPSFAIFLLHSTWTPQVREYHMQKLCKVKQEKLQLYSHFKISELHVIHENVSYTEVSLLYLCGTCFTSLNKQGLSLCLCLN